ncbi:DUF3221 domain-containing protein [Alkalibacillus haloalkaliphilus]|uniref:DUF3221 domain-containing protein n=1 Tax=Alkalibacillus haloalkaliphilus TaxID=94136 RepID=A0A511W3D1_9BACI|nr:DUF3221 domain-containing protein [Alkalibacillus haloalkaliphilus]GEN45595.1 hypothetical protein AHA02nite_13710 [Alkalibacillus haloalkaliphilus]
MKSLLVILIVVFLSACGTGGASGEQNSEEHPGFIGYIAKVEDNQILVTENKVDDEEANHENLDQFGEKAGQAIYFSLKDIDEDTINNLNVGDHIEVIHGAVAESYPGQSSAKEIHHID